MKTICLFVVVFVALVLETAAQGEYCLSADAFTKLQELLKKCKKESDDKPERSLFGADINCITSSAKWTDENGMINDASSLIKGIEPFFAKEFKDEIDASVKKCWTKPVKYTDIEKCLSQEIRERCDKKYPPSVAENTTPATE